MKARTVICCDVNDQTMPEQYRKLIGFRIEKGREFPVPCFPVGTIIDGPLALQMVEHGQAAPLDEECRVAAGLSDAQLKRSQKEYAAAAAGIQGNRDMAMFMADAITGYGPGTTDEKPVYIHGPNWDKWQAAEKQVAETETNDGL